MTTISPDAQTIINRLAAHKFDRSTINRAEIERAVTQHLAELSLPPQPFVWCDTAQDGYRAAWSAAWSAAESAARSAAWSAAESAAWSAESAASAAESAAWSAACSAARSAAASARSAESAAYVKIADKLIALIESCEASGK